MKSSLLSREKGAPLPSSRAVQEGTAPIYLFPQLSRHKMVDKEETCNVVLKKSVNGGAPQSLLMFAKGIKRPPNFHYFDTTQNLPLLPYRHKDIIVVLNKL